MPYIAPELRREIEEGKFLSSPGELSYVIALLIVGYCVNRGLSYQTINDVVGVLSGLQAEFYRRVAAEYEDRKLQQNGDVFDKVWT